MFCPPYIIQHQSFHARATKKPGRLVLGKASLVSLFVIIQHPKITVRIQDEVLALRTYYNSYLGADKARSASGRPTTRDAQHPESGVLNNYR